MEYLLTTSDELQSAVRKGIRDLLADSGISIERTRENNAAKDWLTNAEAQHYLGLSKRTLQRYRDEGRVAFSKIGSAIWYKKADLNALLEANLRTPVFEADR